jgi:hypothetical protein
MADGAETEWRWKLANIDESPPPTEEHTITAIDRKMEILH